MSEVKREHLAGLELALDIVAGHIVQDDAANELRKLIAQASAAPEQEPVGQWSDDEGLTWCDGSEQELASARAAGWMTRRLYKSGSYCANQDPVAEVRYMGYEPTNHLNWLGKNNLQLLPDGTKLYTHADPSEVERLRSALQHIIKTVGQSRSSTRRLRWIEQRALWALDGRDYDNSQFDLPRSAGQTAEKISQKNGELKRELQAATARADAAERKLGERDAQLFDAVQMLSQAKVLLPDFGGSKRLDAWRKLFPAFIARIGYEEKAHSNATLLSVSAEPAGEVKS